MRTPNIVEREVLLEWFMNAFQEALHDDEFFGREFADVAAVGTAKGDSPTKVIKIAMSNFVRQAIGLTDDELFDELLRG